MKIAALADIHSNVFALGVVIRDAQRRGVELMLNLGDVLYGPIAPRATFDLLGEHEFVTIRGNQDRLVFEATAEEVAANPTLKFVLDELGEEPVRWLKSLPSDLEIDGGVYLCHGAPADDTIYLLENVDSGSPQLRSDGEITELLGGQSSSLVICGHTHLPRTVTLRSGQLVVNPGSVGLPAYTDQEPVHHAMENFCPHASYAVIERVASGWVVEHVKVPYEFNRAAGEATKRGRGDWAHSLATGRGV